MGDGCHLMFNLSLLHGLTPNTFNVSYELDYYEYTVYSYPSGGCQTQLYGFQHHSHTLNVDRDYRN